MSEKIPALTICQPWPFLILEGHKTVENRTWKTAYRGPLVIHAGKSTKWMHAVPELEDAGYDIPDDLPFGALLGVVDLIGTDRYSSAGFLLGELPDSLILNDRFVSGPYCWLLANPRWLAKPVPYRGSLGLWDCPRELVAELIED